MIFILSEAYEIEFLKIQIKKLNDDENISHQYKTTNFSIKSETSNFNYFNTSSSKESDSFNFKNNEEKHITNSNHETRLLTSSSSSNDILSKQDIILILYKNIINDILFYSELLTTALFKFYSFYNQTSLKSFNILKEKIKDLLLRRNLFRCIYKIKSKLLEKKKQYFSRCLVEHYNIKPYSLSISPYFSLDPNFRNSFLNVLKIQGANMLSTKILYNEIEFRESIFNLREINKYESMLEKIDAIYNIRSILLKEIDNFWENIPIRKVYKIIDADNLLSLVIYLIIKCQMNDLITELAVIDDLLDSKIKSSRKGYFFNLMNSSLEYFISHFNSDQIKENICEYEKNVKQILNILAINPEIIIDKIKDN